MVHIVSKSDQILKNQDTSQYSQSYEEVHRLFDQLNPAPINVACTAWSRLASQLGDIAKTIRSTADPLHDAWQSKTSPEAQTHLQIAEATATALADQCMQMARATDYAYQYATWYKDHVPGDGAINTDSDDGPARQHMVDLLSRYNEVIATCVPSTVAAQYVNANSRDGVDDFTTTPGSGAGGGGLPSMAAGGPAPAGPGAPTTPSIPNPHTPTHPPVPTGTSPHDPGLPTPHPTDTGVPGTPGGPSTGTYNPGDYTSSGVPTVDTSSSLAGFDGGAGSGGGAGGFGSGGFGAGGGSVPGGLGGLGSGAAGLGSGASGASGLAAGSGSAGGAGGMLGVGGMGAGGAGAAGPGARGGMRAPMGAGGRGGGDDERERSTWLEEDDDVWGVGDAPPPVIGG